MVIQRLILLTYLCQIGEYKNLLKENDVDPEHFALLFLGPNGAELKYIDIEDVTSGELAWLNCYNYYQTLERTKKY